MAFLPPIGWQNDGDEITQLKNYVKQMEEQIRYVLGNLGGENMAAGAITEELLSPKLQQELIKTKNATERNALSIKKTSKGMQLLATKEELTDGSVTALNNTSVQIDAETGVKVKSTGNFEVDAGGQVKIKGGNNTTAVILDQNGIDMQTAGKAILHAQDGSGSYIVFGTDTSDANFSVGMNGDMTAKSLTVDTLMVGGAEAPSIVVAASQPDGHNILWVKPTSSAEKQWSHIPASKFLNEHDATGYYKEYTIPYEAADFLAGDLYYGAVARFYVFDTGGPYSISVTLKARVKNGSSWIDIGQATGNVSAGGSLALNVMMTASAANVMDIAGGSFTLRLECNCSTQQGRLNGDALILKAKTASASGVNACSLFYIS